MTEWGFQWNIELEAGEEGIHVQVFHRFQCAVRVLLRDIGVLLLRDTSAAEGHRCVAGVLSDASEGAWR